MAVMTSADFVTRLKHLALNRKTYYDNSFPSNCGEINPDGSISFDCIGLVKSLINEPDIAYKTSPSGYYVRPGQVIPDTTEMGILNLCSGVTWGNFSNCVAGEYLYMGGHGGVFVGEFEDASGVCNVIECTTAFGGGVTTSYVDGNGTRYNHKGGYACCHWEAHGRLSDYIQYEQKPEPKPSGQISIDGTWGCSTTKALQQILGTEVDGIISNQHISNKKYCPNCYEGSWKWVNGGGGFSPCIKKLQTVFGATADGLFGPNSIKALQKHFGISQDGYCGAETVKKLQEWINAQLKLKESGNEKSFK